MPVEAYLEQLPLEPGHTRPDPCTDHCSRPKRVPVLHLPRSSDYATLCWEKVSIFVSDFHQRVLEKRSNDPKVELQWGLGEGRERSDPSWGSSPAGLCWSSAHLVQCGPGESSWTWTQTWVLERMRDYSFDWTARSSAIQTCQRCQ